MIRYKITLEYDGRPYHGWQRQEGLPSLQQTVEEAWQVLHGQASVAYVAGRTDKGVHARGQVVHIDSVRLWEPWVLVQALNAHLRDTGISVLKVEPVSSTFHARFDAVSKIYVYEVLNRRSPLTYQEGFMWHVARPLDEELMRLASECLLGTHDFTSFRAAGCQSTSPIKTLDRCAISRRGDKIEFEFEARSFLYHQVRNMVGALVNVGTGRWEESHFRTLFEAQNRNHGGVTAPPDGLYLAEVRYAPPL